MRGWSIAVVCAGVVAGGLLRARAQPAPGPATPPAAPGPAAAPADLAGRSLAVLPIDALGMDPEIVSRLETLFRMELERLAGAPLPSRREIDRSLERSPLRNCDGGTPCLTQIGKRLGVELVVSGNVAQLGESYVVNLKVVDVVAGAEVRRVASDPLRGSPDELIEAVRVAAYRLVAPRRLVGALAVLTDLVGASVSVDGNPAGKTPLPRPIDGLPLGRHTVSVRAPGYSPFSAEVEVRFQKTTQVVVRLIEAPALGPIGRDPTPPRGRRSPWYSSGWFYLGVGVAAVLVGGYVGYTLGHDPVTDCSEAGACGM